VADTTPDYSNSPVTPTQVTWTSDGTGFRTTLHNAVGGVVSTIRTGFGMEFLV
jgi:hypothetical protein